KFARVLKRDPRNSGALMRYGQIALSQKNVAKGEELASQTQSIDAKHPATHALLGLVYGARSQLVKARSEFQTAIHLNPAYLPPYMLIAQTYLAENKPDEAIGHYQPALKVAPDNVAVRQTLVM